MNVLEKTEMSYTFSFLFFTINTKLTDGMCILWVLTFVLVHMMSLIVCQLAVLIQFLYMLRLNSVTHNIIQHNIILLLLLLFSSIFSFLPSANKN